MFQNLELENSGSVLTIWLNRPEVKNAFNRLMISELTKVFESLASDKEIRIVVIRGKGDVFCSGADLNWMREVSEMDFEQNFEESKALAHCFQNLYSLPQVVISIAQGAVKGGGNGLLAASDIAIALAPTEFAFTETRLGVVPAVISPYIIHRMGNAKALELMLTARNFSESEAEKYQLVNNVVELHELNGFLENLIKQLLTNSPGALQKTKKLVHILPSLTDQTEKIRFTAEIIARARVSAEGQEGMLAFLEKRKPKW